MRCYLKCLGEGGHISIELKDGEEIFIGRLKETQIIDIMCSKHQVSLKANFTKLNVEVKQLGVYSSRINGFALKHDQMYELWIGDLLEILRGKYCYKIIFEVDHSLNVWESVDNGNLLIFSSDGVKGGKQIAAFDLDGTLITTRSGNEFPVNADDWRIFPYIYSNLNCLLGMDYRIVLFTNQEDISLGKYKVEDYKKKIEGIVKKLNIPIQVFAATGKGIYRKPLPGMWNYFSDHKNESVEIDKSESFFLGTAAGRLANTGMNTEKDHSALDLLFTYNSGILFSTPEQFFMTNLELEEWKLSKFDPKKGISKTLFGTPTHLVSELEFLLAKLYN